MLRFAASYDRKRRLMIVCVPKEFRLRAKRAIEALPFVDSCTLPDDYLTKIWVYMSLLATDEDLPHVESVCRAIVGEDDDKGNPEDP